MKKLVTRNSLKELIEKSNFRKREEIVGRATVILYNNQTDSEKNSHITKEQNGEGFSSFDADMGTKTALAWIDHKTLPESLKGFWLKKDKNGYPRICKYHRQLNIAANKKAEK